MLERWLLTLFKDGDCMQYSAIRDFLQKHNTFLATNLVVTNVLVIYYDMMMSCLPQKNAPCFAFHSHTTSFGTNYILFDASQDCTQIEIKVKTSTFISWISSKDCMRQRGITCI